MKVFMLQKGELDFTSSMWSGTSSFQVKRVITEKGEEKLDCGPYLLLDEKCRGVFLNSDIL